MRIVRTDTHLTIVVQDDEPVNAQVAVEYAKGYLDATGAKFGNVKWEFENYTRRSDYVVAVHFKQEGQ